MIEYYIEHLAQKYNEKMMETINKFLDFLKNGIGEQSGGWQSK
jgi:hypothetical protein